MHQEQPMTYFLFRYESTSGLWVQTKLVSPVSRPLQEAMNSILLRDGTLAFIGTKSEFGQFETALSNRREASSTRSWTSLPEATILATLGLCLNPSTAEGRSLVFHGSPRVLVLAVGLDYGNNFRRDYFFGRLEKVFSRTRRTQNSFCISNYMLEKIGALSPGVMIYDNEFQDFCADYSTSFSWRDWLGLQRGVGLP